MAATLTIHKRFALGNTGAAYVGSVAFDASYPTGGEAVTIPDAEYVHYLSFAGTGANDFVWDKSTSAPKVLAYVASTGAEVANATDLSAQSDIRFFAIVGG
jgi:hypothetical protein